MATTSVGGHFLLFFLDSRRKCCWQQKMEMLLGLYPMNLFPLPVNCYLNNQWAGEWFEGRKKRKSSTGGRESECFHKPRENKRKIVIRRMKYVWITCLSCDIITNQWLINVCGSFTFLIIFFLEKYNLIWCAFQTSCKLFFSSSSSSFFFFSLFLTNEQKEGNVDSFTYLIMSVPI